MDLLAEDSVGVLKGETKRRDAALRGLLDLRERPRRGLEGEPVPGAGVGVDDVSERPHGRVNLDERYEVELVPLEEGNQGGGLLPHSAVGAEA